MVEVVIDSVRVSLTNQQRIVILRESEAERYLPIWIGPYEAEAITIALQDIEVARPQTHDLLRSLITNLGARLARVEIIALREDVFYGNLVLELNGQSVNIDSRPSDALALAVRAHVPILVSKDVMETAGIVPETDIQHGPEPAASTVEPQGSESEKPETPSSSEEQRLSVFEDFLQNLNLGDLSDQSDEDKKDKPDKDQPSEK
jgi:bifunctional DNase/RNase